MIKSMHIAVTMLALLLTACGTTSNIQAISKQEASAAPAKEFSSYSKVTVLDFVDATDSSKIKAEQLQTYTDTMKRASQNFADLLAQEIRATGAFAEVVRGSSTGKALMVSGRINRLVEGNAALRFLVGFGAGSSYFDAAVELTDAESGASLGQITSDKKSWVLGGGIAATQTVDSFMKGVAENVATQLRDAKLGKPTAK